jgi:hypothetical protein
MATAGKAALPPIDDDLAPPRKRLDLKAIQPHAGTDDTAVEENSRQLGSQWGVSPSLSAAATVKSVPAESRAPIASLRIEVPVYLDRELTLQAADQRVTKQYLVLKALQQVGYRVDPVDLVEDKRKARRRKE